MIILLPSECQFLLQLFGIEHFICKRRTNSSEKPVRKPSKSFQIKYFPNILSVVDTLQSGVYSEGSTWKIYFWTVKDICSARLPMQECNLRSFLSFAFLSFPSTLPQNSILALGWHIPWIWCVRQCSYMCVFPCETFLSKAQELCAVTHFLPEARTL